jgi:hypothetical protein
MALALTRATTVPEGDDIILSRGKKQTLPYLYPFFYDSDAILKLEWQEMALECHYRHSDACLGVG